MSVLCCTQHNNKFERKLLIDIASTNLYKNVYDVFPKLKRAHSSRYVDMIVSEKRNYNTMKCVLFLDHVFRLIYKHMQLNVTLLLYCQLK